MLGLPQCRRRALVVPLVAALLTTLRCGSVVCGLLLAASDFPAGGGWRRGAPVPALAAKASSSVGEIGHGAAAAATSLPSPEPPPPGAPSSALQPPRWREVPIAAPPSSPTPSSSSSSSSLSSTVGGRLKCGASVILLEGVATREERLKLIRSSLRHADEEANRRTKKDEFANRRSSSDRVDRIDRPGLTRIPTLAAWERAKMSGTPCANSLPPEADDLCRVLLERVLARIDVDLPSVASSLFFPSSGDGEGGGGRMSSSAAASLLDLYLSGSLDYSSREPAINVYGVGGEFLAHKDAQALTVLVPLSEPGADFDGGGTAFWSQDARGHRVEDPTLVLRPGGDGEGDGSEGGAAPALLFGGCVTHAGLPVLGGKRVVYVASFSSRGDTSHVEREQRDIYGDSL